MKARLLNVGTSSYCNNLQDFFLVQENDTKMGIRLDIKFQNVDTDGAESSFQMFIKV